MILLSFKKIYEKKVNFGKKNKKKEKLKKDVEESLVTNEIEAELFTKYKSSKTLIRDRCVCV